MQLWQNHLNIDLSYDGQTFDLLTLTSEFPIKAQIVNPLPEFSDLQILLNGQSINAPLQLNPFNHQDILTLEIFHKKTQARRTYFINTLNSQFPHFTLIADLQALPRQGAIYGDILNYKDFPNRLKFIYKMDTQGKILYYKAHQQEIADFKKTVLKEKIYYSYLARDKRITTLQDINYFPTQFIIMDEYYNIIDMPALQMNNYNLENHDSLILGPAHYLLSSYAPETVYNIPEELKQSPSGARVVASILQEIKDGEVIWTWKSTDFPEFYRMSSAGNDYTNTDSKYADYVHFNSVIIDPKDQNLIASFRHLDAIIKIERHSGKILWILGGNNDQFHLKDHQKFSHQHYAQLTPEGHLTIFDNGNHSGQSRVLELHLDEEKKTLLDFKSFMLNNYFSPYCGSAQKISDQAFMIGWGGGADFKRKENASMIDFSQRKKILELLFDEGNVETYRIIYQEK